MCPDLVRSHAQVDDAGVRQAQSKHKFTEVAIIGDQDAVLSISDVQNLSVGQCRWIVASNPGSIVPALLQVHRNSGVATCVDQEAQC